MLNPSTVYIGIGSNLDDPLLQVKHALEALRYLPETKEVSHSPCYRSAPLGPPEQPDYINAVAVLSTTLSPHVLLAALQKIEDQQGRIRTSQRWGPRTLDLDILLYDQQHIQAPELTLPHPGIYDRAFVLYPLYDCAPHLILPNGKPLHEWIKTCSVNGLYQLEI